MKIAVISAIFDGKDDFKRIPEQNIQFDYYHFNESARFPRKDFNPRLKAKFFKLQSHKIRSIQGYDVVVWIDGSFEIKSNDWLSWLTSYLDKDNNPIAIMNHNMRSCIYKEHEYIQKLIASGNTYFKFRYGSEPTDMQIQEYKEDGYPENNGLYSGGMFARFISEKNNRIFDDWWIENCKWSIQDQISLPYILWKNKLKLNGINIDIFDNQYFTLKPHTK